MPQVKDSEIKQNAKYICYSEKDTENTLNQARKLAAMTDTQFNQRIDDIGDNWALVQNMHLYYLRPKTMLDQGKVLAISRDTKGTLHPRSFVVPARDMGEAKAEFPDLQILAEVDPAGETVGFLTARDCLNHNVKDFQHARKAVRKKVKALSLS